MKTYDSKKKRKEMERKEFDECFKQESDPTTEEKNCTSAAENKIDPKNVPGLFTLYKMDTPFAPDYYGSHEHDEDVKTLVKVTGLTQHQIERAILAGPTLRYPFKDGGPLSEKAFLRRNREAFPEAHAKYAEYVKNGITEKDAERFLDDHVGIVGKCPVCGSLVQGMFLFYDYMNTIVLVASCFNQECKHHDKFKYWEGRRTAFPQYFEFTRYRYNRAKMDLAIRMFEIWKADPGEETGLPADLIELRKINPEEGTGLLVSLFLEWKKNTKG